MLLLVSFGVFMLVSLIPGDPAISILGNGQPPEAYEAVRQQLGLNDPLLSRYFSWLGHALTGDLGRSFMPPQTPVLDRIASALPVSLEIAILGLVLALAAAVPLAMWSAYHENGRIDRAITGVTFALLPLPSFLLGMLLIVIFFKQLGWFPPNGWVRPSEGLLGNLQHVFLPALTVGMTEFATFVRVLRSDLIATLREDFVLAARARGMSSLRIMVFDALRPSSFSLITLMGISIGRLIGGTVIVEQLFSIPGMGNLVVSSAVQGDVPIVQGAVLVTALIYVLSNLLIDATYGWLDPRIRRGRA